jgi:hypothetical protein
VFEGFSAADLEAFEQKKWSSHAFNRERLEVKLKLGALGKAVGAELPALLTGQEIGVTEERPSIFNQQQVRDMTVFFCRDAEGRRALGGILDKAMSIAANVADPAPHHKHIVLGFRIHREGGEAGLFLHRDAWVDWKNAQQRCHEHIEQERFGGVIASLPPGICYCQGERLRPDAPVASKFPAAQILSGFEGAQPWTIIGEPLAPPALAGPDLPGRVAGIFKALAELHGFIAWRRDNDHHAFKQVLKEQKVKVERQFSAMKPGDEVRVTRGMGAGKVGVIDSMEHKGIVKVRLGLVVLAVKVEDLARP